MNRWRTMVAIAWMTIVVTACGGGSDGSATSSAATSAPISTAVPTAPPPVRTTPESTEEPATAPAPPPPTVPAGAAGDDAEPDAAELAPPPRLGAELTESQPAPPSGDIRDVDFRTGFVYPIVFDETFGVAVTDGEYVDGSRDDGSFLALYASEPSFGDLDGDGIEEAAVSTSLNTGGSGLFDTLHVYGVEGDRVVLRGSAGFGDRADGGLWHHEIVDGYLRAESFLTDQGACCPNMVQLTRLDLGPYELTATESFRTLRWMSVTAESDAADEIRFLPGTSAAVVNVQGFDDLPSTWFEAGAGQRLRVRQIRGIEPIEIWVRNRDDRSTVIRMSGGTLETVLPADGRYEIEFGYAGVDRPEDTVYLVSIEAGDAPTQATWATELRQLVVTEDPVVLLNAAAPQFDFGDGGILNGAIDAWLSDQTDWWVADVLEFPPVDNDNEIGGEFELFYTVPLATDEIVSVHWFTYEYVCCRPSPNTGQRSLVIDLVDRRAVAPAAILDFSRLDEIHDVWFAVSAQDEESALSRDLFFDDDVPIFSSLSVVPGGVEFGTDRFGAIGPTSTFVSWSDLGDLADPAFVARVENGTAPTGW